MAAQRNGGDAGAATHAHAVRTVHPQRSLQQHQRSTINNHTHSAINNELARCTDAQLEWHRHAADAGVGAARGRGLRRGGRWTGRTTFSKCMRISSDSDAAPSAHNPRRRKQQVQTRNKGREGGEGAVSGSAGGTEPHPNSTTTLPADADIGRCECQCAVGPATVRPSDGRGNCKTDLTRREEASPKSWERPTAHERHQPRGARAGLWRQMD